MHQHLALFLGTSLLFSACQTPERDYGRPLPPGWPALLEVTDATEWPNLTKDWRHREELLPALDRSIAWFAAESSASFFPMEGVSHERAYAGLTRYRELLVGSLTAYSFRWSVENEFQLMKSAGWDGKGGGVLFTAYCTPIFSGSVTQTDEFNFPLYATPDDLVKGEAGAILGRTTEAGLTEPYPTRQAIEASALLEGRGLELVWLTSPMDVFIAHVNGSAFVRLQNGSMARFGYGANNGHEYTSLGRELVSAGELEEDRISLPAIRKWALDNPEDVATFLSLNDRYVFFSEIDGNPSGSLGFEVEPYRSLATDKSIFPRGGLCFVDTPAEWAELSSGVKVHHTMLDQDTGGGIRTAGRADIYLGVGDDAEALAGDTIAEGQLYYLFLKEEFLPAKDPWGPES
jgi:membrane-bound lytic murein transglycosylase A